MWAWWRGGDAEQHWGQGQRRPLSVHKFSFYTLPVQTHAYKFRSACNDNCTYTYTHTLRTRSHTQIHAHTEAVHTGLQSIICKLSVCVAQLQFPISFRFPILRPFLPVFLSLSLPLSISFAYAGVTFINFYY